MRIKQQIACTDVILAKDRFTENVTKITCNVPLQVSIIQQYHSAIVYFLVQESGCPGKSDKLDPDKIGMAPNMGLT